MNVKDSAKISVAPMMDWTDRHCRFLHRLISRHSLLYTEMITAPALVRGRALHLLDYHPAEHPVAVQLGGSDPAELAEATAIACDYGYDEVNLNVGCPSDRVQSGTFGAILMKDAPLVARCAAAMIAAANVEVTVKCRIGVDEQDPQVVLPEFLQAIADDGVARVTIHARKAWLQGLSPKENREVPPLDYDLVYRMKDRFPNLHITINGGITTLDEAANHLRHGLDGVMFGRAAYHTPYDILADTDRRFFDDNAPTPDRLAIVQAMKPYIDQHIENGGKLAQVTRHMLGLFAGEPGARHWRRVLSEGAHRPDATSALLDDALGSLADAA